ncbi:dihydrofolate reductase family protein [Gordonia soli]|uniref:Bacterial bifunctional deaminase-reductase C-terminal domain-containing protein n=1 Tax=Gordonia soli NBRC 108243 TaxID=1223545 RepID=M0QJU9_9ACTN|nr:dihydrofolate reductase family protein [Gordonia soli]GAC68875.1 hypothetical protein GS4_19_00650 [Gordonia soli NBRC 108243]
MFHLQKAIHVTPAPEAEPDDPQVLRWLAEQYSTGSPATSVAGSTSASTSRSQDDDVPYIRFNMVASVDGAVTHNGRSGDLGGPGDRAIFQVLRAHADIVVVGARTATTEGYGTPTVSPVFAEDRDRAGRAPAPALALLSRSLDIPDDFAPLDDPGTAILTCRSAPAERRDALAAVGARIVDCGDDSVEPDAVRDWCAAQGHRDVLGEGGPTLLGSFIVADLVDELCLTTSPHLVAGDAGRIAHDPGPAPLRSLRPSVLITDDHDFLYQRWTRRP